MKRTKLGKAEQRAVWAGWAERVRKDAEDYADLLDPDRTDRVAGELESMVLQRLRSIYMAAGSIETTLRKVDE